MPFASPCSRSLYPDLQTSLSSVAGNLVIRDPPLLADVRTPPSLPKELPRRRSLGCQKTCHVRLRARLLPSVRHGHTTGILSYYSRRPRRLLVLYGVSSSFHRNVMEPQCGRNPVQSSSPTHARTIAPSRLRSPYRRILSQFFRPLKPWFSLRTDRLWFADSSRYSQITYYCHQYKVTAYSLYL